MNTRADKVALFLISLVVSIGILWLVLSFFGYLIGKNMKTVIISTLLVALILTGASFILGPMLKRLQEMIEKIAALMGASGSRMFMRWYNRFFYTLAIVDAVLWHIVFHHYGPLSEEEVMAEFGFGFWLSYLGVSGLFILMPVVVHYSMYSALEYLQAHPDDQSASVTKSDVIIFEVFPFMMLVVALKIACESLSTLYA